MPGKQKMISDKESLLNIDRGNHTKCFYHERKAKQKNKNKKKTNRERERQVYDDTKCQVLNMRC